MVCESELLENKAQSDLANAQSLVKNDESGETIGTAMYLAQQCIEKQLKSIVLKLNETMDLNLDQKILQSLSHDFYSKLYKLYSQYVSHASIPELPPNTTFSEDTNIATRATLNTNLEVFKKTSAHWLSYMRDPVWRSLHWRNSMGVPLSPKDLADLNSHYQSYLDDIFAAANLAFPTLPQLTNDPLPCSLRGKLSNHKFLNDCVKEYSANPTNTIMDIITSIKFSIYQMFFEPHVKQSLDKISPGIYQKITKISVIEFGFSILLYQSIPYMSLFPHNIMGRYPEYLPTGENTTVIYKSHIDYALIHLFIVIPHKLRQLRRHSQQIDSLWKLGKTHNCW